MLARIFTATGSRCLPLAGKSAHICGDKYKSLILNSTALSAPTPDADQQAISIAHTDGNFRSPVDPGQAPFTISRC